VQLPHVLIQSLRVEKALVAEEAERVHRGLGVEVGLKLRVGQQFVLGNEK
jgi:hypothetical protein